MPEGPVQEVGISLHLTSECSPYNESFCYFRLSGSSAKDLIGRARYIKSPEMVETSFSMSTIEEEEQENIALSLKNLNQIQDEESLK